MEGEALIRTLIQCVLYTTKCVFKSSACHCEKRRSCDVAIKAKPHFATLDSHAIARNDKRAGTPAPETKTCSLPTFTRNMPFQRRNTSRNGGEKSERRSTMISTRMRGILLRSRHAGEVARLSADLYCKHPVCRSLFATN